MVDPDDVPEVVVTWTKDRERWKRAFREFPVIRHQRRFIVAGGVASAFLASCVALGGIDRSDVVALELCLLPILLATAVVISSRRTTLASVTEGTMTWRISGAGIRAESDAATEYPWSMVVRWRRAADHLIIEVKQPAPRTPRPAAAAPLDAFDAESWSSTVQLLRQWVGDEGVLCDRSGAL